MLKLEQEGSDNQKIALLQSLLEDAGRRSSELETENRFGWRRWRQRWRGGGGGGAPGLTDAAAVSRLINQRLMEEQSQVEELQKSLQEHGAQDDHVRKITLLY